MAKRYNHECKTCGKQYNFCDNCGNVFSYQQVACSPECYLFYQDAVLAARNKTLEAQPSAEEAPIIEAAEAKEKPLKAKK